MAENRKNNDD